MPPLPCRAPERAEHRRWSWPLVPLVVLFALRLALAGLQDRARRRAARLVRWRATPRTQARVPDVRPVDVLSCRSLQQALGHTQAAAEFAQIAAPSGLNPRRPRAAPSRPTRSPTTDVRTSVRRVTDVFLRRRGLHARKSNFRASTFEASLWRWRPT